MLGLVLAGGMSRRFGSDKALARLGAQTLLDQAIEALSQWCAEVVIVGREVPGRHSLEDWPRAGCGPLGGIAAGLRYAAQNGFGSMLSCGVDSVGLPDDLPELLSPAPAFLASQPVIGHWPVAAMTAAEAILLGGEKWSMYRFAETIAAREIVTASQPANINRPEDLEKFDRARHQARQNSSERTSKQN